MLAFIIVAVLGLALLVASLLFDDAIGEAVDLPFISGTAIGGFCAAFGAIGLIVLSVTGQTGYAIGAGLGAGLFIGGAAGALTRTLTKDVGGPVPSMTTIVGRPGVVTVPVKPGSFGEVSVTIGAHSNRYSARSETPLSVGTPIVVTSPLSATAVLVEAAQ